MPSDAGFVEYIRDQSLLSTALTHRKMFGEFALYLDGRVISFVCNNSLFIKPADATDSLTRSLPTGHPYPGSKLYPVADELLDDPERLQALLKATAAALPLTQPRKTRKPKVPSLSAAEPPSGSSSARKSKARKSIAE